MTLLRLFAAAAFTLTASPVVHDAVIVAPARVVSPAAPAATAGIASDDDLQARVEIGPAVLRIYDAKGNVIAIE